jgi:hypothetical protein
VTTFSAKTCALPGRSGLAGRRDGAGAPPTPRPARPEARDTCPGCVALRADVAALVAQLGRRVEALEARRQKPDPARDARLTSAIAAAYGSEVFGVVDLLGSGDRELRDVLGGVGPRALGSWLRRLRRHGAGPYRVERIGRDEAGAVWSLTLATDIQPVDRDAGGA